ncbi:hypothetical protein MP638_004885 [Amoeboaphelidium occidentale]|nr:hypothetical protein MP638_004885 [Amoeboaphelidium occidentale]
MDRKTELELKRQKLAELRKAREERKAAPAPSSTPHVSAPVKSSAISLQEVDDLVASIVGSTPVSGSVDKMNESPSASAASGTLSDFPVQQRYRPTLKEETVSVFDIAPKEKISYEKEVQVTPPEDDESEEDKAAVDVNVGTETSTKLSSEKHAEAQSPLKDDSTSKTEDRKRVELTEEQVSSIVASEEFSSFFDRTSKLIEKALHEKSVFIRDYTLTDEVSDKDNNGLTPMISFSDDRWTSGRTCTALEWSPKYGELCLAAYDKSSQQSNYDSDGVVLVWNVHLQTRPEFVFESSSSITSAVFSPYHPNFIIATTYSGQVLLFDTRAKSLPVLKSPLSDGHSHPVYSSKIVGTQNAHDLVTVSSDGLMCSWQFDMLAKPVDKLDIISTLTETKDISVTACDFPENDSSAFIIGTESGILLEGSRFAAAGGKAGIRSKEVRGHQGPISGLDFHSAQGPVNFSNHFLTSSFDWTVKLWKRVSKRSSVSLVEVMSFESFSDYVYDVSWSPSHPAVFAAGDATGNLSLWNINTDRENPVSTLNFGNGHAINKLAWGSNRIAVGTSEGQVHVAKVGAEFSQVKHDDYTVLQRFLNSSEDKVGQ